MLLQKVTIRNFRCFASIDVDLDETTVIIGENNSGKTSFLEAIRLCLSRTTIRKSGGLDEYDYHLPDATSQLNQSGDLSITLNFRIDDGTADEIIQGLTEAIVSDSDGRQNVVLELFSKFEPATKDFITEWRFLNTDGLPLGARAKKPHLLSTLVQFVPLFCLSALRDAGREFQARSLYWAPFLKNANLSDETRRRLQSELNSLNADVLDSHASLASVKAHLAKIQTVVSVGNSGTVDIEALPGRLSELLSRTQINITGSTGASLPLAKHGAGTQSLAVIFLFEAFAATMLADQFDPLSRPLLALEEPEAHLHPCAIRSLWTTLRAIEGQTIIATHSGDLLARVPLTSVRRFCRVKGIVAVKRLMPDTLDSEELRKIEFHLKSTRGELLFARCWLMGEGESEYWVLNEMADILGYDLDRLGIRVVAYQNCGIRSFLKVANAFGISWFVLTDGDIQGANDKTTTETYLEGKIDSEHIRTLPQPNLEEFFCASGFGHLFEGHISQQKKNTITEPYGSIEYWKQVIKAKDGTPKPAVLREVINEIRKLGVSAVPSLIREVIEAAIKLSEIAA